MHAASPGISGAEVVLNAVLPATGKAVEEELARYGDVEEEIRASCPCTAMDARLESTPAALVIRHSTSRKVRTARLRNAGNGLFELLA